MNHDIQNLLTDISKTLIKLNLTIEYGLRDICDAISSSSNTISEHARDSAESLNIISSEIRSMTCYIDGISDSLAAIKIDSDYASSSLIGITAEIAKIAINTEE